MIAAVFFAVAVYWGLWVEPDYSLVGPEGEWNSGVASSWLT